MYYRLVKMTGKWYAAQFADFEDEEALEAIEAFVEQGEIVVISDDLETFAHELGVEVDDIEIVGV